MRRLRFSGVFKYNRYKPNPGQKTRASELVIFWILPSRRSLSENQRKRKERQVLGLCERTKKVVEREGDGITNYNWRTWNGPQRFGKRFWKCWKSDDQSRLSRLQHWQDRQYYWEEARRPEAIGYHWHTKERSTLIAGVKNSQGVK